jgi:TatD DNase family protein
MLIDSHCHLDRLDLSHHNNELANVLAAANARDVAAFLCVCINEDNKAQVLEIAARHSQVLASVGVHPSDVAEEPVSVSQLIEWAQAPKVVALGETGLDYHYGKDTAASQQTSFANHLMAAGQLALPVIVHTREAQADTLAIMRDYSNPEHAGVMHCFTEDWAMAKAAMDMNYYISISGIVTFRNAEALRDLVKKMPLERLLVETDSPYLAPIPYRGKPNIPVYVREVAEYIADLKGVDYPTLARITSANFLQLFKRAVTHLPELAARLQAS